MVSQHQVTQGQEVAVVLARGGWKYDEKIKILTIILMFIILVIVLILVSGSVSGVSGGNSRARPLY